MKKRSETKSDGATVAALGVTAMGLGIGMFFPISLPLALLAIACGATTTKVGMHYDLKKSLNESDIDKAHDRIADQWKSYRFSDEKGMTATHTEHIDGWPIRRINSYKLERKDFDYGCDTSMDNYLADLKRDYGDSQ